MDRLDAGGIRDGDRAADESLLFALPPELRKDMKAAGIA
jgi:hypothetical protein